MDPDFVLRVLMGLGTLAIGYGGWLLTKRGQRDSVTAQQAANQLQTRVNTVDELEGIIDRLTVERTHLEERVERLTREHTEEAERQAARCRVQIDRLVDNVATLQSIVSDEIARAAALSSVKDAQTHQAEDHDRTWDEPGGGVRY